MAENYVFEEIEDKCKEIIKEEANRIISEYPTVGSVETALKAAFGFATQNRRAIMHIYNSVSRDIFERYLWEVCSYIVSSYGKTIPGSEKLNEFDSELISRFFICQCFGIVMNWLNGKQTEDVSKQISRFCAIQRGLAEEMINKCIDK